MINVLFTIIMLAIRPAAATPYEMIAAQPVEWSRVELEQLVVDTFPENPSLALRVVDCESKFDPTAVSVTGDHGLWQINQIHMRPGGAAHGVGDRIYDPVVNSRIARVIYEEAGGFGPWTCARKG